MLKEIGKTALIVVGTMYVARNFLPADMVLKLGLIPPTPPKTN
jgi:hypothetical protein